MKKQNIILWFILLSLVILFGDSFGFLTPIKDFVQIFSTPVKREVYQTFVSSRDSFQALLKFPKLVTIVEENQKLEKDNTQLKWELEETKKENEKLRNQLEAPLPRSYKFVPAPVLGISRFMEIGAGHKDGVEKEMIVVDGDVYVGIVVEVTKNRSIVKLPTDLESKIPVKTSRDTLGTLSGFASKNIILEKVLQKDSLFLEDLVVTSGQENYPPNLIIGKIVHIDVSDVEVYKKATVEPLVDYNSQHTVFVIKDI